MFHIFINRECFVYRTDGGIAVTSYDLSFCHRCKCVIGLELEQNSDSIVIRTHLKWGEKSPHIIKDVIDYV